MFNQYFPYNFILLSNLLQTHVLLISRRSHDRNYELVYKIAFLFLVACHVLRDRLYTHHSCSNRTIRVLLLNKYNHGYFQSQKLSPKSKHFPKVYICLFANYTQVLSLNLFLNESDNIVCSDIL